MEDNQEAGRVQAVPAVRAIPDRPRVSAVPAQMAGAARIPQGGAGATIKQQSIFGNDGGRMGNQVPLAAQAHPELQPEPKPEASEPQASMGAAGERREMVFARPLMGQASTQSPMNAAPPAALEPYPQIDRVIKTQSVGTALSRVEVTAILDSLGSMLTRISAPENANSTCVKNLGPGAVEKATTLKNKMEVYAASNPTGPFSDFTADELAGADKILACAGELAPPGASSTGQILGWLVFGAAAVGTYFLVTNTNTNTSKSKKGK